MLLLLCVLPLRCVLPSICVLPLYTDATIYRRHHIPTPLDADATMYADVRGQVGIGGLGGFDMLNKVAYSIETDDSEYFDECTEFFDDIDAKLDTMQERWEQEMKTRIKKRISQAVSKLIDLTGVTRCHAAAAITLTRAWA